MGATVVGEPFFVEGPDGLEPSAMARSPWGPDMLHGRLLAGLAAWQLERDHLEGGFAVSRLTVDMFRSAKLAPVTVRAERVRDGNRVRAVDVVVSSLGVDVARATALLLKRTDPPGGTVWSAPAWHVPQPSQLAPPAPRPGWEPSWETRPVTEGGFEAVGRRRTWLRETRPLVAGADPSPLQRVAMAADIANPLSNAGDRGLEFINADLTLYLATPPTSDWIGLEVTGHESADGLAIGSCDVYDLDRRIGWVSVCAVSNTRDPAAAARAAGRRGGPTP